MEMINECHIEMHNATASLPYNIVDQDETFGLFTMKLKTTPIRKDVFHFMFTMDTTLSMLDRDNSGNTKMKYMKETLIKMVSYLESLEPQIYVTIYTFNVTSELLVNDILLTKASVQFIEEFIKEIKAENCTNIQNALETAITVTSQINVNNPERQVAHIFMTDGEANSGIRDPNKLADLIDTTIPNVFIGFGKNHNSTMLRKFAQRRNCEYYFVDNLENSVLVYAESVHNILYGVFYNVEFHITNGELYDYDKNEWTNVLHENVLSSESHKFYQLRTKNPEHVEVYIYEDSDNTLSLIDVAVPIPYLFDQDNETLLVSDLTKYAYRQKVQGLLFTANNTFKNTDIFSRHYDIDNKNNNDKLLTELREVFKTIQEYMKTNNLMEDPLLKLLCDDIYVTITAIDYNLDVEMYAGARQTSQGRQRSYNVGASISNEENCNEGCGLGPSVPTTKDYNDIPPLQRNNYVMERSTTTCFASPTMLNTFRDVSQRTHRSPSFGPEDDVTIPICSQSPISQDFDC
jgi:hypothetical protein